MRFLALLLVLLVQTALAHDPSPAEAAETARHAFVDQCHAQQALMPPLLTAIRNQDLSAAKTAYVAARPPYEQIETLALIFPELDAAIDARPYAYHTGEDDPLWAGFHLLERAIYRDQRLQNVYQNALALNDSVNTLCLFLENAVDVYSPSAIMAGSIALAFEVPAKKVASEEEAWSELSLMIFRNNWRGIWSQVEPFLHTPKVRNETRLRVTRVYQQLQRVYNMIDPENDFFTNKGGARVYSTIPVSERKDIIEYGYKFATALEQVRDDLGAELGEEEEGEEDEQVSRNEKQYMRDAVVVGLSSFVGFCEEQQRTLDMLCSILGERNLTSARFAYAKARPEYERIEVMAADFPDLDANIDARPYAYSRGELDNEWKGFHEVERALYRDDDIDRAIRSADVLKGDVDALCETLRAGINGEGTFSAKRTFEGMITLAYEVPAKKISSEEETWSDLSVMIFRENLKGIWTLLVPFLDRLPAHNMKRLKMAYRMARDTLELVVDRYNDWDTGLNFMPYSKVPVWERKRISDAFYEMAHALVEARETMFG
ncbi:Efem/EfeO family lipoprotein [Gracilariopsis chorda]|uniref:Efem/EfeO family lipoprotein n=1 Tax=Gracilariopsis chorda TaxID=448386 RepID=A0A2V3J2J3_9FLOR|nr:Efem/EfeO family lipoprotein [Gracilariopsis chorda]|eukprot:PXF48217.1 Efem/EfeO family lipoprotein [Gracilariopsis chorda]